MLASTPRVFAEEFYCYQKFGDLKTFEEKLPDGGAPLAAHEMDGPRFRSSVLSFTPSVVLDGAGEIYIDRVPPEGPGNQQVLGTLTDRAILAVRLPEPRKDEVLTGWLYVPREQGIGMQPAKFFMRIKAPPADSKMVFARTKAKHYAQLVQSGYPGTAWFQNQIRQAQSLLQGQEIPDFNPPRQTGDIRLASNDADRLFALFSGSRAIDENLQLDRRVSIPAQAGDSKGGTEAPIPLDGLKGISVAELDWKPLIAGRSPEKDPLASLVPVDQHALFLPGIQAAVELVTELKSQSAPIWRTLGIESRFQSVLNRYEKQLGVRLEDLVKSSESQPIQGLVLTGSDPYFVAGTDIALLIQSDKASPLHASLKQRLEELAKSADGIKLVESRVAERYVSSVVSMDRRVSAYLATSGNAVILSNSATQIAAILETQAGKRGSLASSQDYQYFRLKYLRKSSNEIGFLVLSDATIRRWCGPRWRIASARRMLAASALAAIQADRLGELIQNGAREKTMSDLPIVPQVELGEVKLTRQGMRSSIYGSLDFQTPISELPMESVTKAESEAYGAWRDSYQRNWRGVFDPIAIQIGIEPGKTRKLKFDLTVTPLILQSDYHPIHQIVGDSRITETSGDPHPGTMFHAVMAIDTKSALFQSAARTASDMTRFPRETLLSWIGKSASLYLDESPIWNEILQKPNWAMVASERLTELPLALHVDVVDGVKLALFLTSLRTFAEQSAPGMLAWETREYKGKKYVRVRQAQEQAQNEPAEPRGLSVCYFASPRALVLTPNQATMERYLDRVSSNASGGDPVVRAGKEKEGTLVPRWIGRQIGLRLSEAGIKSLAVSTREMESEMLRLQSWSNLPILNEWHRLAPERDPVQLHEELWGERLICPGGGKYVWDDRWRTMKSTVYEHPGAPRPAPKITFPFANLKGANLGASFEDGGLRGRVELDYVNKY